MQPNNTVLEEKGSLLEDEAMARIERDFEKREESERLGILADSWCDECAEADLGMTDPVEYEEDGQIYVEGFCQTCGNRVVNLINEVDFEE